MGLLEDDANRNWETQTRCVFNVGAGPDRQRLISDLNIHIAGIGTIFQFAPVYLDRSVCARSKAPFRHFPCNSIYPE